MRMKLYSQVLDVCVIYAACSTKLEQLNPTAKHKIHRFFSPEDDVRAQGGSLLPEGGPLDCWSRTSSTSSSTPRQAAGLGRGKALSSALQQVCDGQAGLKPTHSSGAVDPASGFMESVIQGIIQCRTLCWAGSKSLAEGESPGEINQDPYSSLVLLTSGISITIL